MIRNMIGLIIVLASAAVLFSLLPAPGVPAGLHGPAGYYVERGVAETGSVNLVTAVVVAYRGWTHWGRWWCFSAPQPPWF